MRNVEFSASEIQRQLDRFKVCTFEQLTEALGTQSRVTVFRKLGSLPYLTSYSHRGKYYALRSSCQFDAAGLWSHEGVWFSAYGTLLDTCMQFVERSPAGYSASDLDNALHVQTRQALLQLLHRGSIEREKIGGLFVYLALDPQQRQRQIGARLKSAQLSGYGASEETLTQEVRSAMTVFFGLLNERQRRLFAGLEAMKIGRGGNVRVAALLGIDPHTVARGRLELLSENIDPTRVRRPGGGRVAGAKKLHDQEESRLDAAGETAADL